MQTAREKIRELRALHDDGLLSGDEFERRKNAILDAEYTPGGTAPPARQGTELGLMAGQEIGPQNRRYRLERLLGMGGMGQVWQATDLATHAELGHSEQVALKILPPQLTQSPTHARLLIEEATQARRLAHDNIVRVYEWAQDPATASYFIIMECLEGEDLETWLAAHGPVPFGEVERILRPVASALQYAWDRHRLVHRDLKPGNVFLTAQDNIKLLDFGIAARARDGQVPAVPNAGTAGYRAPEAGTSGGQPTPKLDVYAIATMIYQMLANAMPGDGSRSAETAIAAPPGLNGAQWQALQKGLAFDAEERFDSVTALLDAMRRAAGPSAEELAAQAAATRFEAERREHERQRAQLKEAQERLHAEQRAMEQARSVEAAEQRRLEIQRHLALTAELTARRKAEAQAIALKKVQEDQARRDLEKQRRLEAEVAAQARKEQLRQQLIARREADAAQARAVEEERVRKAAQLKAEAAYKAEQERARREQAVRNAAELAVLMPTAPVADPSGVLRDRFLDGSAVGPDLVLIPTGRFQMGGTEHEHAVARKAGSQPSWLARELPTRWVGIERSFALGRYPVTVGEWRRFVRATAWEPKLDIDWKAPGFEQDDWHPVVGVSWHDAQLYLQWLSAMTGARYRLPSEAEWEYACRAGSRGAFSFGDEISTGHANYDGHSTYGAGTRGEARSGTTKAGSFPPNAWGLYDMHGNVWEWTQDVAHEDYQGAPVDGSAWEEGGDPDRRMVRGGAWLYQPRYLRSAARNGYSAVLSNDVVGFRVARQLG